MVVTSSVAYSAFTHICPRNCLGGLDLLQMLLWNSVLFHRPFKSRVQENWFFLCFVLFTVQSLWLGGFRE